MPAKPPRPQRRAGRVAKSETALVKGIIEILPMHGVWAWRNNRGRLMIPDKNGGPPRPISFGGENGAADILGIIKWSPWGVPLAIECKRGRNKPSDDQRAWGAKFTQFGGFYIVAYSVQEVCNDLMQIKEWLKADGAPHVAKGGVGPGATGASGNRA